MTDIVQTVKSLVNEVRALKAIGDTQAVVDLQATLDAANADLDAAIADANGRLDTLNNTTLPGLTKDLQQAQKDITDAKATLLDHDKAISDANGRLDTLDNTTLPGLDTNLQQAQKDITSAQGTLLDHDKALATAQAQLAGSQQSVLGDKATKAQTDSATALSAAQSAVNDSTTQVVNQWAQNTSRTVAPTTGWQPKPPTAVDGKFIWMRTIIGYGSGDYQTGDPVCITGDKGTTGAQGATGQTGAKGDTGAQGPQGVTGPMGPVGPDGKDGTSIHVKGSVANAAALPTTASDGDGYITQDDGHLFVYGSGVWTDSGVVRGPKGSDGLTPYLHTAYADSADGKTNFSTTNDGTRLYWGNYSDHNSGADSTNPADYTWTRVLGPQGATGSQGPTGPKGATGAKGATGDTGVSVSSVTPYYALGSSAPAKPGVLTPPSPWVSVEPAYQQGQNLYRTTRILYSDNNFSYTNVVLDSSYQYAAAASKAASDAAGAAAGKSDVLIQSATPVAAYQRSTTLWINTTGGANTPMQWDGSKWFAVTDSKAIAAANAAAEAQSTADMALANAQELLVNGGFEAGLSRWTQSAGAWSTGVLSGVAPLSGKSNAWPTSLPETGPATLTSQPFPVRSGRTYRVLVSAYQYYTRTLTLTITPDAGTATSKTFTTNNSINWLPYSMDVTMPAGVSSATLTLASDSTNLRLDDASVKDITEAKAAQEAANTAQVTADGKNRIFTRVSEPSHTGLVAGDTWRQINNTTDRHVTAYKVWNGSAFVPDYMDLDSLAVAGSLSAKSANIQSLNTAIAAILKLDVGQLTASDATVDTAVISKLAVGIATVIKLNAGTITTGQLSADRIDVNNLVAKIATILKLDVGNLVASGATVDTAVINKLAVQIATVIKLNAGTITTGQLSADRIDVNNLVAKIATILKLDVSHLIASDAVIDSAVIAKIAAQIITANKLQTSPTNPRSWMDTSGFHTTDANDNKIFDTTAGQTPLLMGANIRSTANGGVLIGPDTASPVTGKPWISQDGMSVDFTSGFLKDPAMAGYVSKMVSGVKSNIGVASLYSGKVDSNSGESVVYAQSDPSGNNAAGFEVYDKAGNLGSAVYGISDGHLYLTGNCDPGMWSAMDYEPFYSIICTGVPHDGNGYTSRVTYKYPVPYGIRHCIISMGDSDGYKVVSSGNESASGFTISMREIWTRSGSGNVRVNFIARWLRS